MQLKNSLLILLLTLASFSCKEKEQAHISTPVDSEVVEIPDDFLAFYKDFHADSTFQLERISFPLGEKADGSKWTMEEWTIHKPIDNSNEDYLIEFDNFQGIIIEVIQDKQNVFRSERRFSKLGGKWNLIFYKVREINLGG